VAQLFRRILVPHDFSDAARRALQVAIELAAEHRGRITVLHAIAAYAPGSGVPGA
jgi:nucleotide-binding universal stress UspA family protein